MRGWRRNSKPAPAAPLIAPGDRMIAAYSGFTPEQWAQLPEPVKRDHREHITWRL